MQLTARQVAGLPRVNNRDVLLPIKEIRSKHTVDFEPGTLQQFKINPDILVQFVYANFKDIIVVIGDRFVGQLTYLPGTSFCVGVDAESCYAEYGSTRFYLGERLDPEVEVTACELTERTGGQFTFSPLGEFHAPYCGRLVKLCVQLNGREEGRIAIQGLWGGMSRWFVYRASAVMVVAQGHFQVEGLIKMERISHFQSAATSDDQVLTVRFGNNRVIVWPFAFAASAQVRITSV